jgi:hypothetical protein
MAKGNKGKIIINIFFKKNFTITYWRYKKTIMKNVKGCKPICSPSLICTATPAFLYSTDRKWIYAKYTMTTQK